MKTYGFYTIEKKNNFTKNNCKIEMTLILVRGANEQPIYTQPAIYIMEISIFSLGNITIMSPPKKDYANYWSDELTNERNIKQWIVENDKSSNKLMYAANVNERKRLQRSKKDRDLKRRTAW